MEAVSVSIQFNTGSGLEEREMRLSRVPCVGEYIRISQVGPVFVVVDVIHTPDGGSEAVVSVDVVRPSRVPKRPE
jgi:hypothetical protein